MSVDKLPFLRTPPPPPSPSPSPSLRLFCLQWLVSGYSTHLARNSIRIRRSTHQRVKAVSQYECKLIFNYWFIRSFAVISCRMPCWRQHHISISIYKMACRLHKHLLALTENEKATETTMPQRIRTRAIRPRTHNTRSAAILLALICSTLVVRTRTHSKRIDTHIIVYRHSTACIDGRTYTRLIFNWH